MGLARRAVLVVATAVAVRALWWGTAEPLTAARTGVAGFDEVVALAAAITAWALLGWVVLALVLTALAAVPGAAGAAASRFAGRIAPGLAGQLARVALGLSLAAAATSACSPALAGGPDGSAHVAADARDGGLPGVSRIGDLIVVDANALADRGDSLTADSTADGEPAAGTGYRLPGEPAPTPTEPNPAAGPSPTPSTGPSPTPFAGLAAEPARERPRAGEVVVKRGDTLWAIAARHLGPDTTEAAIAAEWPRWYRANRAVIGDDPHLIIPGTILRAPTGR